MRHSTGGCAAAAAAVFSYLSSFCELTAPTTTLSPPVADEAVV